MGGCTSSIPAAGPSRPDPGCASSLRFPYGGGGPEYDPACHPANALPVQSYRHSHYGKNRVGATLDGDWFAGIGPVETQVRAGLWFEQGRRELGRDWHRIVDARVSNDFDETPYWRQYDWRFPQRVARWYVEETLFAGPALLRVGVRQYLVEVTRQDRFAETPDLSVSSNSDPLLSGGITWTAPVPGLELFAGYAQNFKSLPDRLLEVPGRSLAGLEPETADNLDLGLRYSRDPLALTATAYRIDFSNRIFFLHTQTEAGPSYLVPGGGAYFNAGGVESRGVELSATCRVGETGSLYASWTWSDADYIGVGDPLVDAAQGIAPGSPVVGIPGYAPGAFRGPDRRCPGRGSLRQVHLLPAGNPRRLVGSGRLLARRRLRHLVGGRDQRQAPRPRSGPRRQQPPRPDLPVHDHRPGRLPRRSPDRLAEPDRFVLSYRRVRARGASARGLAEAAFLTGLRGQLPPRRNRSVKAPPTSTSSASISPASPICPASSRQRSRVMTPRPFSRATGSRTSGTEASTP